MPHAASIGEKECSMLKLWFNPVVVEILANETGATVVTDLYTDSVGDAPLDSYESVMRWNVDRVVEALGR